jgi:large subunit ribosomal protein L21
VYAVIETGGKQVTVREGDVVKVEKVAGAAGDTVTFDRVLMVGGETTTIGDPTVKGASVQARVVRQARARKIIVMKYKAKAHQRRKTGHRQSFTEVRIERIGV